MHKVVCFGEVLWDILPTGEMPGGAPMNVAYHLQKLGMEPALITRIGNDDYGARLKEMLTGQKVSIDFLQTDFVHPTGIVNATIKENHEVSYDIVYPAAWDFIEWNERLDNLLEQAGFFVFGSLSARNETSRSTLFHLLEKAHTKVLDINLRPPHYNREMVEHLLYKADILKLNEHELPLIAAWQSSKAKTVKEQVASIQHVFSIPVIVVTRGGEGAFLNVNGNITEHIGYKVTVADTIGSGDAFLAAFLYMFDQKRTPEETLSFANALGAFVATHSGACPVYNVAEVTELLVKLVMQKEEN